MADLIPFATRQIGSDTIPTVDGRDIYAFLGITKPYSPWIKAQLKRAHLIENEDFTVYYQPVTNPHGGRPTHDYYLSFDAAKHVAMISGAGKGHEVRTYFIQKEKELDALNMGTAKPQVKNPANQMLIDTIVRLDGVEQAAQEARAEAAQANANAARAMETQLFYTVAEYVYINKLQTKIPESAYKACSDHLRCYCLDRNIPFRKVPVGGKRWDDEYGYHQSVYAEALPGWLARRFAQQPLQVLRPVTEEAATP